MTGCLEAHVVKRLREAPAGPQSQCRGQCLLRTRLTASADAREQWKALVMQGLLGEP